MSEGFDVVEQGRLVPESLDAGKRRLVARLSTPVLHALEQRGLFAEDVAPGRNEDLYFEVKFTAKDVLSECTRRVGGVDRCLHRHALGLVFVPDEDPTALSADAVPRERHALDHEM